MVGLFSRFSASRNGHRRTQSALDDRGEVPPSTEVSNVTGSTFALGNGFEVAIEFKPVEHPTEPVDTDRPIQCPLPEPSILNDGRIWKERACAGERRTELPVMQEDATTAPVAAETNQRPPRPPRSRSSNRMILPSASAPEHNILKLLEECNSSGI